MNKFKRILSVILIAAMALSLMPTFASADGTTSYTYMFNPTGGTETYTTKTHTFETTKKASSSPWQYLGKYGLNTKTPRGQKWPDENFDMNIVTSESKHGYAAFKIQIPESGVYSVKLLCTTYKTSGNINVYLLPGDTVLNYDENDTFDPKYKLNNSGISLYSDKTTYDTPKELDNTVDIAATDIGENGAERILIIQSSDFCSGQTKNYMYIKSLTLTKTADAEEGGELTPPDEEEKKDPITLTFNKDTVTVGTSKVFNSFSTKEGQNFGFVSEKSSSTSGTSSSIQTYGLLMNNLRAGKNGKNWFGADKTTDPNVGRLTISANDIPAGTYKLSAGVHNFTRGCGVYYYVNDEYVGYDDAYATTGAYGDENITTEETIGYVTVLDKDEDAANANPVEISLCTAAVDYITNANLYVLRSITFTPVDEIPSYGELDCTVDGEAAKTSYSIANGDALSVSAMLSAKHLNGYNLDGTKDSENYIKITSSNPEVISVTDTEAALDSAKIYASGYKPVYTLTALRSNASAIITVEAVVDGKSIASKEFTVLVAKSDADTYEPSASFAWGTTLPSMLVAGNVSVAEKDGVPVNVGSITASKGTTYTLSAKNEIVDGDSTYKFIGWKRGTTSNGASAFIGYETGDEYTVWSNTYITAVYDKISDSDEKRVEFYDQDSYYLGYMTESQFKENGIPTNTPKLLGHTFSNWQYVDANGETKEFTADTKLTENVTRVVALQIPAKVTITYKNENNEVTEEKTYDYDGVVDALADSGISDVTYWTILAGDDEKTVRTSNGYSFYAWANTTLKGYTGEVTEKLPKAVLHNTPHDDSYMIEYDRYSKSYTIVEAGILLGDSESISLLSCEKKYTSAKGGRAHGQFAAPHENYDYVRGYIIYKTNETGAISVVYTDAIATGK